MRHVDGAPMGTRGGISVIHTFPADGDYSFKVLAAQRAARRAVRPHDHGDAGVKEQIEVSINGERAALLDLNTRMSETDPKNSLDIMTPPIHINAGPQRISAAFIQRFDGPVDDLLMPLENTLADVNISFGVTALPHMRDFTDRRTARRSPACPTRRAAARSSRAGRPRRPKKSVRHRDREDASRRRPFAAPRRPTTFRTR